jgi:hypothetical protein
MNLLVLLPVLAVGILIGEGNRRSALRAMRTENEYLRAEIRKLNQEIECVHQDVQRLHASYAVASDHDPQMAPVTLPAQQYEPLVAHFPRETLN